MTDSSFKLTKKAIDSLGSTQDRMHYWDSELKGFGLRQELSGTKTFILRYRLKGEGREGAKRFFKIGRFGELTPDAARIQAKALLGQIAEGLDRAGRQKENRRKKQEEKLALTFEDLAEKFLALHMKIKRKSSTSESYKLVLKKHGYPFFVGVKAKDVTS